MARFLNLNMFSSEEVKSDMLKKCSHVQAARLDGKIKGKGSALEVGRDRGVAMRARAQAAGRGAPLARR